MSREAIYSALFEKVSAAAGFATASRLLQHWGDVAPAQQPALFQTQKGEAVMQQTNRPPIWRYSVDLYVYAYSNNPSVSPAIQLNGLIDAIETALAPAFPPENQTLGGLVTYARISGQIQTDEGVLGQQAVAIIPIEIEATA